MCSVVLENLSGSARTDYKSNHIYIERYKSKRKNVESLQSIQNKRIKGKQKGSRRFLKSQVKKKGFKEYNIYSHRKM